MVAAAGDIEHRVEVRSLTGGGQHAGGAAFQRRDLCRDGVIGRVLQARVEIAARLQVKKLGHLVAGGIFEGGGLDDGDLPGLAVSGRVARLYALGADALF